MDKKEYILNQFKKTFNKKYENYCIGRIYHLLNDDTIHIVTQQMFKRNNNLIALADLYFPQLNLIIEINEGYHKNQLMQDKKRAEEIIKNKLKSLDEVVSNKLEIIGIDATLNLVDLNKEIDSVVKLIKNQFNELGNQVYKWNEVYMKPDYYIEKGYIDFKDNVKFRTVWEVSELFNMKYNKGSMVNFKQIRNNDDKYFWCPHLKLNDEKVNVPYTNEISLDGETIYETSNVNPLSYVKERLAKQEVRYIFGYYRDPSGIYMYKFRGVFVLNKLEAEKTLNDLIPKLVWNKLPGDEGNIVKLEKYFD